MEPFFLTLTHENVLYLMRLIGEYGRFIETSEQHQQELLIEQLYTIAKQHQHPTPAATTPLPHCSLTIDS
jgi:hypothetical protein